MKSTVRGGAGMYSHGILEQVKMYCECCRKEYADRPCVCVYKPECDDIRRTYGCTPDDLELSQKEGV